MRGLQYQPSKVLIFLFPLYRNFKLEEVVRQTLPLVMRDSSQKVFMASLDKRNKIES